MWKILLITSFPTIATAEALIAQRNLHPKTVISDSDISISSTSIQGSLSNIDDAIGKETKVSIYMGQPIRKEHLRDPILVERNSIVTIIFKKDALTIQTEGRALGQGAENDIIRVMNLSSRSTLTGTIGSNGEIFVGTSLSK